jgi:putative ABC transport system permease protein
MFVITGIITLIIALTTVSIQTLKAAKANPVKSLKTE